VVVSERKTDGGKGDRIPGADPAAYERGFAGINWHAREEEAERNRIAEAVAFAPQRAEGITVFGKRSTEVNGELIREE